MTADTKAVVRYRAVLSHGLIEVEANPAGSFVLFTDHERIVEETGLLWARELVKRDDALSASRAEVEGLKKLLGETAQCLAELAEACEDIRLASEECDIGEGLAHAVPFHEFNEFLGKLDAAEQHLAENPIAKSNRREEVTESMVRRARFAFNMAHNTKKDQMRCALEAAMKEQAE